MTPRYDFTIAAHHNALFIFGGFDRHHAIVGAPARLEYFPAESPPLAICHDCSQQDQEEGSLQGTRQTTFSAEFMHSLALDIGSPFRAIELIIDSAAALGSTSLNLSCIKNKDDYDLLAFHFDSPGRIKHGHS